MAEFPSEWVADLRRNQWPGWVGIRKGLTGLLILGGAIVTMQQSTYVEYQGTVSHWAFDPKQFFLFLALVSPKFYWAVGMLRGWKHAYYTLGVVAIAILLLWGLFLAIPLFAPGYYRFSPLVLIGLVLSALVNGFTLKGIAIPASQRWFGLSEGSSVSTSSSTLKE